MNINNQAVSSETVSLAPQVPRKRKHGQKLSANVYVVEDTSYPLDKKFIVKKINTTHAKKDKQSNVSELEILKNVNHNRIVQICGFVLKANKLSIFMDYLEQGTLAKYIQETNEHGLDIEEVRIFTRQILEGVSYLHNFQPMIIHRNIKGTNILLLDNRNIKLTDFALSKMITSNSNNTAGVGTFKWMAPEVIHGCGDNGGNKGFKADIWSTGVTVVEMATGKPIFPDSTDMDAIIKIGSKEPPEYRLPANSPNDLKEFLDEVLSIDPDNRPTADGLLTRPFLEDEHEIIKHTWEKCNKKHDESFNLYLEKKRDDRILFPVDKFNLYYLPDDYRDHDIALLINHLADLVVKVKVSYISVDRPASHKGLKYPGYKSRGTNKELTGSGRVWDVYSHLEEEESRPCECRECVTSGAPKMSWGEVNILTAKHVVFDESEAKFTSCFLNFNNRYSRPMTLAGTGVGWNDLEQDICYLRCVTHDVGLVGRLREGLDAFNRQCDVVYKKYKDKVPSADFIAVVSHPHGWYKQISFGSCSQVEKNNDGGSTYHYTACTCRGSSGAPVYFINKRELRWVTHHHSRTKISGLSWS